MHISSFRWVLSRELHAHVFYLETSVLCMPTLRTCELSVSDVAKGSQILNNRNHSKFVQKSQKATK